MQHRVLASNTVNMDTLNYKAFELVVEEAINKNKGFAPGIQLVRTHADHLPIKNNRADNVQLKAAEPPEFGLRGDVFLVSFLFLV